jgi:site-specific DNA recombinase
MKQNTHAGPRRAAVYARVSTGRQADHGGSLPTQEETCRAEAARREWEISAVYIERGVSGKRETRPELDRLLRDAEAGRFDVLIIPKLDRLGRSARFLFNVHKRLQDASVELMCLSPTIDATTPHGRAQLGMLAVFAEFEREMIGERVADHHASRKAEGLHNGKARYGYVTEKGRWSPHPTQADVVRRVFAKYVAGASQLKITQDLNRDGTRSLTGSKWTQGSLSKVLRSPHYAGLDEKGERCPCGHEALVDEATWARAEALRESAVRHTRGGGRGRRPSGNHLFTQGLLRCGVCGDAMLPRTEGDVYFCASGRNDGRDHCTQPRWPRSAIDTAVVNAFQKLHLDLESMREDYAAAADRRLREITSEEREAERDLMDLQRKEALIERDYEAEALPAHEWLRLKTKYEAEREATTRRAAQLARNRAAVEEAAKLTDAEEQALRFLARTRKAAASAVPKRNPAASAAENAETRKAAASAAEDRDAVEAQRAALLTLFEDFSLYPPGQPFPVDPADGSDPKLGMWSVPDPNADPALTVPDCATIVPRYREGALLLDPEHFPFPRIGIGLPALDARANNEAMRLQT